MAWVMLSCVVILVLSLAYTLLRMLRLEGLVAGGRPAAPAPAPFGRTRLGDEAGGGVAACGEGPFEGEAAWEVWRRVLGPGGCCIAGTAPWLVATLRRRASVAG